VPTPDDLAGGIADADKLILNAESETADNPGEVVWNGTSFVMRDSTGLFNPRTGGSDSIPKHITANIDVPADHTMLAHRPKITDGVTVKIADGGTWKVL